MMMSFQRKTRILPCGSLRKLSWSECSAVKLLITFGISELATLDNLQLKRGRVGTESSMGAQVKWL